MTLLLLLPLLPLLLPLLTKYYLPITAKCYSPVTRQLPPPVTRQLLSITLQLLSSYSPVTLEHEQRTTSMKANTHKDAADEHKQQRNETLVFAQKQPIKLTRTTPYLIQLPTCP